MNKELRKLPVVMCDSCPFLDNNESACSLLNLLSVLKPAYLIKTRSIIYLQMAWLPSCVNDYVHYKVWNGIINSLPNFNGAAVEAWEEISNFILHFTEDVIAYPSWDESECMLVKRASDQTIMGQTVLNRQITWRCGME